MPAGFLLRFAEHVRPLAGDGRAAKTKTFVEREQPDEGLVVPFAATKTLTEVKREQPDTDPSSRSFYALPR
jgi:hypothetical protein